MLVAKLYYYSMIKLSYYSSFFCCTEIIPCTYLATYLSLSYKLFP